MNASSAMASCPRTAIQMEASRRNGARSKGPVTAEGKARSALNGTRHGLCSSRFFLLPDEDPQAFALFVVDLLALLAPRDQAEHQAAERAAQAKWRAMRADRLEAEILAELFAAKALPDVAESRAVRLAATKALSTMLRYRARVQRDLDRALAELAELQRRRHATEAARTSEPETVVHVAPESVIEAVWTPDTAPALPASGPEVDRLSGLAYRGNRHERRRLAALRRRAVDRAAA